VNIHVDICIYIIYRISIYIYIYNGIIKLCMHTCLPLSDCPFPLFDLFYLQCQWFQELRKGIHKPPNIYIYEHIYTYIYKYTCICIYIYTYKHTYIYTHTYVYLISVCSESIPTSPFIYVYINIHIYISIFMYT
jgi:hypothetical protein